MLAYLLERVQNYSRCLEILDILAEQEPENTIWKKKIATIYGRTNRQTEMLNVLEELYYQNPRDADIRWRLGSIHESMKNNIFAIKYFMEAIELDPDNLAYRKKMAKLMYNSNIYDGAMYEWERCLKINPDDISVHLQLAQLHEKIGNLTEAGKHFRIVLEMSPNNRIAKQGLAHTQPETDTSL